MLVGSAVLVLRSKQQTTHAPASPGHRINKKVLLTVPGSDEWYCETRDYSLRTKATVRSCRCSGEIALLMFAHEKLCFSVSSSGGKRKIISSSLIASINFPWARARGTDHVRYRSGTWYVYIHISPMDGNVRTVMYAYLSPNRPCISIQSGTLVPYRST